LKEKKWIFNFWRSTSADKDLSNFERYCN